MNKRFLNWLLRVIKTLTAFLIALASVVVALHQLFSATTCG